MANKYGITIPEKFSGETLRDYVIQKLKNKGLLTDSLKDEILTAKISEVRKIAVENKIKNIITMNKKETIEYILERVWEDYKEPENQMVYEMSIPINPDEEKYSTLLLQYEQMGGDIQELKKELEQLGGDDRLVADSKLKEKEKELEETKAQLEDITKRFSALEVRTGAELDNKLYNKFDDRSSYEGLDQQTINNYITNNYSFTDNSTQGEVADNIPEQEFADLNEINEDSESRDIIVANEDFNEQGKELALLEDEQHKLDLIEKLRLMANATGYSALLVTLYVLLMVGVGLAFFLILLAAI